MLCHRRDMTHSTIVGISLIIFREKTNPAQLDSPPFAQSTERQPALRLRRYLHTGRIALLVLALKRHTVSTAPSAALR